MPQGEQGRDDRGDCEEDTEMSDPGDEQAPAKEGKGFEVSSALCCALQPREAALPGLIPDPTK